MRILLHWVISALSVLLISHVIPGIDVGSFVLALGVAIVLGIVNVIIKPILVLISLPLEVITLGLFTLVINGVLLWLVAYLIPGFDVADFTAAFLGALIISVISAIGHRIIK
ncbi:MAG: phage holin family protein [Candidatus Paceibacterota bacterium]|jgi:putative membrane protein